MVESRESFSLVPVHFVLVVGALIGLVVAASAYGTNNPSVFGHSSDEIEYAFTVYVNDCSSQMMGSCSVSCSSGTLVSGSCETSRGWGHMAIGAIDGITYECSDASFVSGTSDSTLIARVVCLS